VCLRELPFSEPGLKIPTQKFQPIKLQFPQFPAFSHRPILRDSAVILFYTLPVLM
jgi:hypothetical protein